MPTPVDTDLGFKGSESPQVVLGAGVGLPAWLDVPGPDFSDDGLPDPLACWGRHVRGVCVAGVPVGHGAWTRTHGGRCPPLCHRLPEGAPANPWGPSPAWDAWQAFMRGQPRIPVRPVEPPETEITLHNRGGWNQYACVTDDGPMPRILP
jgi:hypothetical protein